MQKGTFVKQLPFLLSWRYLRGARQEKTIATMVYICIVALAIGTCSLGLSIAIMRGFEQATYKQMQNVHAQIIMQGYEQDQLALQEITPILQSEFPAVAAYSPYDMRYIMIKSPHSNTITNVVAFKGVIPEHEAATTALQEKLVKVQHDTKTLAGALQNKQIIIGEKLAQILHVTLGDSLELLYVPSDQPQSKKLTIDTTTVTIGGIFKTGIEEYDANMIIGSLELLQSIFPDAEVTAISMRLQPYIHERSVIDALRKRFELDVYSWKDLYPALIAALTLEKYASIFILGLICIVACMNSMSLLFMYIQHKHGDIAILTAMGADQKMINATFLILSSIIGIIGASVGTATALLIGAFLHRYSFITLPDAYYVTHLPIALDAAPFIIIFISVIALSAIASWIPIKKRSKNAIIDLLRFEP